MVKRTFSAQLIVGILDERRPTRPYIARPLAIPNWLAFLVMLLWSAVPVARQIRVITQTYFIRWVALLLPGGDAWASATG